jgi:hypothetical protein
MIPKLSDLIARAKASPETLTHVEQAYLEKFQEIKAGREKCTACAAPIGAGARIDGYDHPAKWVMLWIFCANCTRRAQTDEKFAAELRARKDADVARFAPAGEGSA